MGGHSTSGRPARVGGEAAVTFNRGPGTYGNGSPAMAYMLGQRLEVLHRRLPELFKRVGDLENSPGKG